MTPVNKPKCSQGRAGTRVADCFTELGIPDGFVNVSSNWTFDPKTETFDEAYILANILNGNFTPFIDSEDFTPNNEANVFVTRNTGRKKLVRRGLIEQTFVYSNGRIWHGHAASNDHSGSKRLIFVYKTGEIVTAEDGSGNLRGFRLSHQTTEPFKDNDGTNPGETMIMVQLTDTDVFNTEAAILREDELGIELASVFAGSLESYIESVAVPAVGGTDFVVKVAPDANRCAYIAGINDFQVSGQTVATVVFDPNNSEYTISTDPATAGNKTITIGAVGNVAAQVGTLLYSGSTIVSV